MSKLDFKILFHKIFFRRGTYTYKCLECGGIKLLMPDYCNDCWDSIDFKPKYQ